MGFSDLENNKQDKTLKSDLERKISVQLRSHVLIDTLGLYVLCALLIVQPFHYVVTEKATYYREIFAVIFLLLSIHYLYNSPIELTMRKEVFFLLLSFFTLIIFALFDPSVKLYETDSTEGVSENITDVNLTLYVLRNALLYIPMVCYLALRGLSEKEVKLIAGIVALAAPFSIVAFLWKIGFFPMYNIMILVSLGGEALQWNSYVPYLTFPFIASLYLVVELRYKVFRLLFLAIGLCILLYALVSASRQSVSFCVLMSMLALTAVPSKKRVIALLIMISIGCIVSALINYTVNHFVVHDNLLDRYSSVGGYSKTSRFEIMYTGLGLIEGLGFLVGAGLSSVLSSGPHNDFIRWTQRIGIPGMVLSFLPFFLSLLHVFKHMQRKKRSPMLLFIISAQLYTIYHSFFGYPREDAYQALYSFLGLALWLGISKSKHIYNQIIPHNLHS